MPTAEAGYAAPTARVPRTIFQHALPQPLYSYPPRTGSAEIIEAFLLTPDNLNGLDSLTLWCLGGFTGAFALDIDIHIGTCDEAYNIHTQQVLGNVVNTVLNEYECFDLTTPFAVVLANLVSRDMIRVQVVSNDEEDIFIIGLELQET